MSKINLDTMSKRVLIKAGYNSHNYSLRLSELKEDDVVQNDIRRNFFKNPIIFSLAEYRFWFIAK